jgi:hypothetical protein
MSMNKKAPSEVESAFLSIVETRYTASEVTERLSVDRRSTQCNRSNFTTSQIEREVVSVTLVHNFHTQVSAVDDVCPSVDDATL